MSNKESKNKVVKATTVDIKFKRQKREVVGACAELLAQAELEIAMQTKKFIFWRNMAIGLFVALLVVMVTVVKLFA